MQARSGPPALPGCRRSVRAGPTGVGSGGGRRFGSFSRFHTFVSRRVLASRLRCGSALNMQSCDRLPWIKWALAKSSRRRKASCSSFGIPGRARIADRASRRAQPLAVADAGRDGVSFPAETVGPRDASPTRCCSDLMPSMFKGDVTGFLTGLVTDQSLLTNLNVIKPGCLNPMFEEVPRRRRVRRGPGPVSEEAAPPCSKRPSPHN